VPAVWKPFKFIVHAEEERDVPRFNAVVAHLFSLGFAILVLLASIPSVATTQSLPKKASELVHAFFPQGWAFFTKDAQSSVLWPFDVSSKGLKPLIAGPNASPANGFGWNRIGRYQGVEMAGLLKGLGKAVWHQCSSGAGERCVAGALARPVSVTNQAGIRTLCGSVVLEARGTTPWAYRRLTKQTSFLREVVALEVACPP
jgi:antimicrobial peptide system SdpA family protein